MRQKDKMRAAVIPKVRSTWQVEEVPVPKPAANQVLIKIHASGLCYSDVHLTNGDLPFSCTKIPDESFEPSTSSQDKCIQYSRRLQKTNNIVTNQGYPLLFHLYQTAPLLVCRLIKYKRSICLGSYPYMDQPPLPPPPPPCQNSRGHLFGHASS
jgi:hypothetical protein